MNLRPYQTALLAAVREGWDSFSKQLAISPTGTGKTICFCHMAKEYAEQGKRTLILVDQSELAFQTVDKMERAVGLSCDVEKAERTASRSAMVVVATVQSLMRRLDDWPADHFGLVIADEADKSICDSWLRVLRHFDGEADVCGFTATPNRSDKKNLGSYYENIAFEATLFDFIGNGKWAKDEHGNRFNWLSPISVKMLPITIDLNSVRSRDGDFDANELHDAITPHLTEAANAIRAHASFRKVLVFVPLIATSQKFVSICNSIGLAAEHIDGTSEDRAEKLERFGRGDFDILVNSALLLRGVDIPTIDCVVMLRPTKSISLYQQAIGRGTRLAPDKTDLLLLDFLYDAQKKLVCHPAHLIATSQEEAEAITGVSKGSAMPADVAGEQLTAFDLLGMATIAQAQRERALRKKLEEHKDRKAKHISAEEFALKHKAMGIAEYEPTMPWESQPMTDKQASALKRFGIDPATVKGKGHASKLISLGHHVEPVQFVSPKQAALLRRFRWSSPDGLRGPEQATRKEFARFMGARFKKQKEADAL